MPRSARYAQATIWRFWPTSRRTTRPGRRHSIRRATALAHATGVATTAGYGPRYLHSTGQLHKGGPNTGVFVVIAADAGADLPVPGEPFSFGVLEAAQALGDFQSLGQEGRRAVYVRLSNSEPAALAPVIDALARPAP